MKHTFLTFLAFLISLSAFATDPRDYRIVGITTLKNSDQKIKMVFKDKVMTFSKISGNSNEVIKSIALEVMPVDFTNYEFDNDEYLKHTKSKEHVSGYKKIGEWSVVTFQNGIYVLFPVTIAMWGGYSLAYVYLYPADVYLRTKDLLTDEDIRASRKLKKMLEGKRVTANEDVFNALLRKIEKM